MVNVCVLGRILRVVVGISLISLAVLGQIGMWGWVGLVPLALGLIGWCPVNKLIGMESCNLKLKSST